MPYALPHDLELPAPLWPPKGKWRVVEFVRLPEGKPLELLQALSEGRVAEGDIKHSHLGTLRSVVGDYDHLEAAFDQLRLVRYPNARRIFNDMGAEVAGYEPGSEGTPEAGPEA